MTAERDTEVAALSFEAALARLETIVRKLEQGDTTLEESITLFEEGQHLRGQCEARLADAEARIELLQIGTDGRPRGKRPLDDPEPAVAAAKRPSLDDDLDDDDVPF